MLTAAPSSRCTSWEEDKRFGTVSVVHACAEERRKFWWFERRLNLYFTRYTVLTVITLRNHGVISKSLVKRKWVVEWCAFPVSSRRQVAIKQKALLVIIASSLIILSKLRKGVKSKPTSMCNVWQVVVPGAPGKLLQFSVGQVKSPARSSLLERLLHAPAGRYCGRQLGSIPSSHQTYRSTFLFTLFDASGPLSYPVDSYELQTCAPFADFFTVWGSIQLNPRISRQYVIWPRPSHNRSYRLHY